MLQLFGSLAPTNQCQPSVTFSQGRNPIPVRYILPFLLLYKTKRYGLLRGHSYVLWWGDFHLLPKYFFGEKIVFFVISNIFLVFWSYPESRWNDSTTKDVHIITIKTDFQVAPAKPSQLIMYWYVKEVTQSFGLH